MDGKLRWVTALWNTLLASDLFGVNCDWAHPAAQPWDPALHLDSSTQRRIQIYEGEKFCNSEALISYLTHCSVFPQFHHLLPPTPLTYHNAICFRLLPVVHTVVEIISVQQLLLDATVQIKTEWVKTKRWKKKKEQILTTAVAFAQTALAGLDRRSRARIAGCVARTAPLLSSYPTGHCALCPLWPRGPSIVTVHSWNM